MTEKSHFIDKMCSLNQHAKLMGNQVTLKRLKQLGIFSASDARRKIDLPKSTLSRLVKKGLILRVGRGRYLHPQANVPAESVDYAVACAKFGPKSVIGGLTALFHYHLVEQVPQNIWVIVPPAKMSRDKLYRCLRSKNSFRHGITDRGIYRITNVERTLIEALHFSSKIGLRIVIQAIRRALEQGLTTERKLGVIAEQLKLKSTLLKHWEYVVE